jgi:cytochrome b pre-mRNA-processing protein 3
MALFSRSRRRLRQQQVDHLYAKAVAQARQPWFYRDLDVPDSVDGRFDLLVLHMFLLLHRLGGEGPATRALAQALFDLMFADMDQSLREMGVSDMAVGKRVKEMARAFYGRIDAYEPVLADPAGLKEALARNLYRGLPVADDKLARLATYVQVQVAALAASDLAGLTTADGAAFAAPEAA